MAGGAGRGEGGEVALLRGRAGEVGDAADLDVAGLGGRDADKEGAPDLHLGAGALVLGDLRLDGVIRGADIVPLAILALEITAELVAGGQLDQRADPAVHVGALLHDLEPLHEDLARLGGGDARVQLAPDADPLLAAAQLGELRRDRAILGGDAVLLAVLAQEIAAELVARGQLDDLPGPAADQGGHRLGARRGRDLGGLDGHRHAGLHLAHGAIGLDLAFPAKAGEGVGQGHVVDDHVRRDDGELDVHGPVARVVLVGAAAQDLGRRDVGHLADQVAGGRVRRILLADVTKRGQAGQAHALGDLFHLRRIGGQRRLGGRAGRGRRGDDGGRRSLGGGLDATRAERQGERQQQEKADSCLHGRSPCLVEYSPNRRGGRVRGSLLRQRSSKGCRPCGPEGRTGA